MDEDMEDKFERFVKTHRQEFEEQGPPERVWKGIEAKLPTRKRRSIKRWRLYSMAAAISLLLFAGIWLFDPSAGPGSGQAEKDQLGTINSQAAQQQVQYFSMIELKRDEIKALQQEDPELYHEFDSEIEKLEKDYNRLKAGLDKTPNQERIVEAMIQNLQAQINLLNQQLHIIRRLENLKKAKNNENQSI